MASTTSRIGRGVVIRGTIRGDGDLTVEGRVEGSLEVSGEIEIGETGQVRAPISADRIVVRGAVAGDVRGTESVILEEGARVVGDLAAPSVGIRPGGLLRGYVSTTGKSAAAGAVKAASRAARTPAVATQAPRAHRPASLQRARDEAVAAAPAPAPAPSQRSPVKGPALPRPPARPVVASPPSQKSFVEPATSPMTRASGKPGAGVPVSRESSGGPPPPVVPSLKKGARGSMKKKAGR